MRGEYTHLRERILKEMETTNDLDKAQFLRNEIAVMSQKLGNLESSSSAYVLRYLTQMHPKHLSKAY